MDLIDNYGDTPILESVPAEGTSVPRSPRKEVAEWIESELTDIIPYLTEDVTENTYGKPTKWMAEALLAKLYINWAVYTAESVDQYDAATAANPNWMLVLLLAMKSSIVVNSIWVQ